MDIRHAQTADLPALTEIYNHYVLHTPITFDIDPKTMEQRAAWLAQFDAGSRYQLLVAVADEQVLGYANTSKFREKQAYETSVETTIYLHHEATGRGIGHQLYTALLEAVAGMDVHRAFAGVTLPNDASVALHRGVGFETVGTFAQVGRKFDRYWDVLWLARSF